MENQCYSFALKSFFSLFLSFGHFFFAQGYAAYLNNLVDDPVSNLYSNISLLMKSDAWEDIEKKLFEEKVKKQFEDLKKITQQNLLDDFKTGIEQKNKETIKNLLFRFYAETIQEKFYWNLKEGLKDLITTTVRLTIAKAFFSNVLAPRILEGDRQSQKTETPTKEYETILGLFDECEIALGSAGVFGLGAVPPDTKRFREKALKIVEHLKKFYTFTEISLPE